MTSHLVTGIAELVTHDERFAGPLGTVRGAALVVEDGRVAWVGPAGSAPAADRRTDVDGRAVLPGFVDSHTHLVFAGDRADEFAQRMAGAPYTGGGITRTVTATRAATDDDLRGRLGALVAEARAQGTTTLEVKSGYGLDVPHEERLLRLAREVTPETTFLGAHVVPPGTDRSAYVDLVTGPMLAACAPHARWADVFCEPGSPHAFDGDESRAVLTAAASAGLGLRVHGNQLGPGPGARLAVELGAASLDHATHLDDTDVAALADAARHGGPVVTLLPGVELSTRSPFPDARRLVDAGVEVALATDCNPGTCFTTSMPLMVALGVAHLRMTVEQAVRAATLGGARALRRDDVGHLRVGARADLCVVDAPTVTHLAYRPGVPLARTLELR
ncbi:imidazolonepropionase [Cellulomonas fimi]|uniref:Imidazolonepropionase n=1 Tax=Cellulomonas fimi (strain ATCC 484 / DSM 20113 / JCM 1341 / CCUG 24087 / LMG 16345 / NBRC 15513 / NCIMB 8980 / NCTC 7547 / NRS-133) TaxID=590998 RepID=F4H3Z7_CELFA|nr:imidazolonepropionase [Cellulomonas fimi]AEE44221.1 imidazolonepropionase [Cellulomonas fimi ATCC 484]NNH05669.1 imidazolonepropionase [Cellulomonas fimi]VEH25911.1 Imidazolonepropionase [Cellulomonas fimi]